MISFFFNDTATTEIYTLSLHDALPISRGPLRHRRKAHRLRQAGGGSDARPRGRAAGLRGRRRRRPGLAPRDRKSTRLNSSHVSISYAVFCLKKKKLNRHKYSSK